MEILFAIAAAVALLNARTTSAGAAGGVMSEAQIRKLAADTIAAAGFNIDPAMLVRIAFIESSFNPAAVRVEPAIGDASGGLMQTLAGTARWLAEIGYRRFAPPSLTDLQRPEVSMYFGAAYLDYLANKRKDLDTEEKVVRGYNGGPLGWTRSATAPYWKKYQDAKARFG